MTKYVRIIKFCELTGFTRDAVDKLIKRHWHQGKHYRKTGGVVLIDLESYEKWVEQQPGA
jgi:predicted DNA-binding transcriptional regulator AlpA